MSGSPYTDLDRPPLHEAALRRALLVPGGLWTDLRVVAETGSTNADVAALARSGTAEGAVLVAESQVAGRGRRGREWRSPPRAGLAVSVLLRPGGHGVTPDRYGWLPLLAGVALVQAVERVALVEAALKWPNDLLVGGRKCAGILAESVPDPVLPAVVLGIGLNVTLRPDELPRPDATSLALAGAAGTDRDPLLRELLRRLATWYGRWCAAGGDADGCGLAAEYRQRCATLGRTVRVDLPGGAADTGLAEDVDADGRLVLAGGAGRRVVAAGDVVHLR
jgi:BirA family biotin operon repressor/biotin-[acetyl-CoA-carboxylase] ligase